MRLAAVGEHVQRRQSLARVAPLPEALELLVRTVPRERQRDLDEQYEEQQEVQAELQRKLSDIAGMEIFAFGVPSLPGSDAGLPVSFVIASTADYDEVLRIGEELVAAGRESGLFAMINQTLEFDRPEIAVNVDRPGTQDKAVEILRRAGAEDIVPAEGEWRDGQWQDYDPRVPADQTRE